MTMTQVLQLTGKKDEKFGGKVLRDLYDMEQKRGADFALKVKVALKEKWAWFQNFPTANHYALWRSILNETVAEVARNMNG